MNGLSTETETGCPTHLVKSIWSGQFGMTIGQFGQRQFGHRQFGNVNLV